jgi:hypothetical protein
MVRRSPMLLTLKAKKLLALSAALFCLLFLGALCPVHASDPHSASYSTDDDNIFWFIQTSDVHIGARGVPGSENLAWLVSEAKDVIDPSFIVVTGDLTDSSNWNEMGYPDGPHIEEWEEYRDIVLNNGMDADFYYDLPGNHDHFGDETFYYYLNYSIQGFATGQTQVSWTRNFDFGTYHFLGINTCGHDGADFSMLPPTYGDNAGLDTAELEYIQDELEANKDADLTMIFGHHLIQKRETDWTYVTGDALEEMTMTALIYGGDALTALMEYYHPLMYAYGHSHVYREEFFVKDMSEGVFYLNVASLSKNDEKNYNIIAIDNNGISTTPHTVGVWPAVIITAPLDKNLGMENDPYTADAADLTVGATPIRALVFDKNPVTRVDYRMYKTTQDVGDIVGTGVSILGGLVESEDMWCSMTQVDPSHPDYPYLWEADCPNPLEGGDYTIEVRASGSTTQRDAVPTAFPADPVDDEGICFITTAGHGKK